MDIVLAMERSLTTARSEAFLRERLATIAGDVDLLLEIRRALCECEGVRIVEGRLEAVAASIHSAQRVETPTR